MMTGGALDVLAGGGTVITATPRLARHLRETHDIRQRQAGKDAWPDADVLPIEAWLHRCREEALLQDTPAGQLDLLSEAEMRLLWGALLGGGESLIAEPMALAGQVAQAWRTCQAWLIGASQLAEAAATADERCFAGWAAQMDAELSARRWVDSAGLARRIASDLQAARLRLPAAWIGFAGFDPWPPVLVRLSAALTTAGCRVVRLSGDGAALAGRRIACVDVDDELRSAARWAHGQLHACPTARVAVVLADLPGRGDAARRACLDVLAPGWALSPPAISPVAMTATRTLADYPLVHAALLLLGASGGEVDWRDASQLLRSPFIRGYGDEAQARARIEWRLREKGRMRVQISRLASDCTPHAPVFAGCMAALCSDVPSNRRAAHEWAPWFMQRLEVAGWPGDIRPDSAMWQVQAAWQELLAGYAATSRVQQPAWLADALHVLQDMAGQRVFHPESHPGAVQILSLREADGLAFDGIWVAGMTASQWPGAAQPDALIPLGLQRGAGLPESTAAGTQALATRRLARILSAAGTALVSWPASQDEVVQRTSTLLHALPEVAVAEIAAHDPPRLRASVAAMAPPLPVEADEQVRVLPEGHPVRGGARTLTAQAQCPARAFITGRLHAGEITRPRLPLDRRDRGNLVHGLLEQLYRDPVYEGGLKATDPLRLREHFERAIAPVLARVLPDGSLWHAALRELEHERLWGVVRQLADLDIQRMPFVVQVEVPHALTIGGLTFTLRIDRIERHPGLGQLVIDYKSTAVPVKRWRPDRLEDCQLPLYALAGHAEGIAVFAFTTAGLKVSGVAPDAMGLEGTVQPEAFVNGYLPDKQPGWTALCTAWREQLEGLAHRYARGDFRVNPYDREYGDSQFGMLTRLHELALYEEES